MIAKAMARNPNQRYASAHQFSFELTHSQAA